MTHGMIETVRRRMLDIIERDRLLYRDVAEQAGYSWRTVGHFLRGEPSHQSAKLASAIAKAYPETAEGMVCQTCGRPIDA